VGRRLLRWVDRTRVEPVGAGGARQLMVWVWYPAQAAGQAPAEPALPGAWGVRRAEFTRRTYGERAAQALASLRVHAVTGRAALGSGRFPVVLFSPGSGWLPTDYSLLLEDLASHGYVVVGLAGPSLACVVRLPDGREVTQAQAVPERLAVEDLLFARAQLASLDSAEDSPVRGRLDLGRLAALGHSLGGVAAVAACAEAPGLRACMNLDGDFVGPALSGEARQPLLYVTTDSSPMADSLRWWQQPLGWNERRRTRTWKQVSRSARVAVRAHLAGTLHGNFADAALLPSTWVGEERREGRLGPIGGERGLRLTGELVRSFLAQHLVGRAGALPGAPAWHAAEVKVSTP
jgi:predicted dienelactone hydrolase